MNWVAPSTHATSDWISIFAQGADTSFSSYNAYAYVPAGASGTLTLTATDRNGVALVPGTYEVRYLLNDSFTEPTPPARSGPITVTSAAITSTSFLAPSANTADTSGAGDNNGFETTPSNAHVTDGLFAVDTNSGTNTSTSCTNAGKDKHRYYNYNFNVPSGVSIRGIEVRLDARADSAANSPRMCAQLSWNGDASWTTALRTTTLSTTTTTFILGGATNTWGRTWTVGDFSTANFRVRIIDVASSTARDFSLDGVAVQVTYQ